MTAPVLETVQLGWTSQTPQIVVAAFLAAEHDLDRPLQAGDTAACCPAERLAAWPWSDAPTLCCPGCGTIIPAAAEEVTA